MHVARAPHACNMKVCFPLNGVHDARNHLCTMGLASKQGLAGRSRVVESAKAVSKTTKGSESRPDYVGTSND